MRFCFISAVWASVLAAATAAEPAHQFTAVVRADPRSGRLVRALAVSPREVRPVAVRARVIEPLRPSAWPDLDHYVEQIARRYELEPELVRSVIEVESGYNPFAVSPKGARGLMQLMPQTAQRLGVRDVFNPWENIEGGVRYLKYLLTLFGGDKRLALAAYNAGEAAVFRYRDVPPYPETLQYVYRVGQKLGQARRGNERREAAAPKLVEFVGPDGRIYIQTQRTP